MRHRIPAFARMTGSRRVPRLLQWVLQNVIAAQTRLNIGSGAPEMAQFLSTFLVASWGPS